MSIENNPLFAPSTQPFDVPNFKAVKPEHFKPAFEEGLRRHKADLDAVAANPAPATFENTIVPLELAGKDINRVYNIFGLLVGARTTPELQAIEAEISPIAAAHFTEQGQRQDVFSRVLTVYNDRASLNPVQARLVEEYHIAATNVGISLPPDKQALFIANAAKLSEVYSEFNTKFTNQTDTVFFVIDKPEDLAGLPQASLNNFAKAATDRELPGKWVVPLMRNSVEEFLSFSTRRDLREQVYGMFVNRNNNGDEFDTNDLIPRAIALKQEKAQILGGYKHYGEYALEHNMAKTPEAAMDLMKFMLEHGKAKFKAERAELQALAASEGFNEPIQPWDFDFYATRYKKQKFGIDEGEVKKYLKLENVQAALFDAAHKLFGVTMTPRPDIELHHPDAKAWEVKDRSSKHVGVFFDDLFARPGKSSGAWMSEIRGAHGLDGGQTPIIYNICNFTKPEAGQPALLSFDDARTLFHEFGHGLHGLLSTVIYPSLAGTNVRRDNVELPSQFMEHYLTVPAVMAHFRHVETGQPMPQELVDKIKAADSFGEGRAMVRYAGSALIDLEIHQHPGGAALNLRQFEADMLKKYDMPEGGDLMHRLMHHSHSMSGYPSQYYVYRFASVYDHDAFAAFEEAGDPFHPPTAASLHENIYASGNSRAPDKNYHAFRGKEPDRQHFLRNSGFIPA